MNANKAIIDTVRSARVQCLTLRSSDFFIGEHTPLSSAYKGININQDSFSVLRSSKTCGHWNSPILLTKLLCPGLWVVGEFAYQAFFV
jgi:hypothetical protein